MVDLGDDIISILVTGAKGYLGAQVCAMLRAKGQKVLASHRLPAKDVVAIDLLDPKAVFIAIKDAGVKTVVHCAAVVPKEKSGYDDRSAADASVNMVRNLLAAPINRMVFASSMTVYGPSHSMPVTETCARGVDLTSAYARAKWEAECLIRHHPKVNHTIVRLPGLFGFPRRNGLIYNVAKAFSVNNKPKIIEPFPVWGALHIDDAGRAIADLTELGNEANGIFNVGYKEKYSIPTVVALLAHLTGQPAPNFGPAPSFEMDLGRLKSAIDPDFLSMFAERLKATVEQIRKEG